MHRREYERFENSIHKIREAIEYAGDFLTEEEFDNMCVILARLEKKSKEEYKKHK